MKTTKKTTKKTPVITKEMVDTLNRIINRSSPEPDVFGDPMWVSDFSDEDYNVLTELAGVIKSLSKKTK